MAYHRILSKLDRAIVAYLIAQGAGTAEDIFPAKNSLTKTMPCTVVMSGPGTPEIISGNYTLQTQIDVKTPAPEELGTDAGTAKLASDERTAKTFDCFFQDTDSASDKLAEDITNAARALAAADPDGNGDLQDFTVLGLLLKEVDQGFEEDGDTWTDTLKLEVLCCPSNVS